MKKIKFTLTKLKLIALSFFGIASAAALTSCSGDVTKNMKFPVKIGDGEIDGGAIAMYGVPFNSVDFHGVVTGDIDGDRVAEPVPNISIKTSGKDSYEVQSDEKGEFHAGFTDWEKNTKTVTLTFEDADGEENGKFKSKSFDFDISDLLNSGSVWGRHKSIEQDVELERDDQ